MALNPLSPVVDYQSMLNRIFWFTSAAALGAVSLLRSHVPAIDAALEQIDLQVATAAGNTMQIPGGYLLPALLVGLFARVFRMHGHIADWLEIRERFDIDVIIKALAREAGVDVERVPDELWIHHRHDIMRQAFYRFAGTKSPQIDEHLVHQALDSWSWFWIGVEATLIFLLTGMALVALGINVGLLTVAAALTIASIGLPAIRQQCKRYALAEVKAIVSDSARAALIRQAFECVGTTDQNGRRAA
jgi:hypothetical protein